MRLALKLIGWSVGMVLGVIVFLFAASWIFNEATSWRSKPVTELWSADHAPDHPATFPEARYLKCVALQVQ